MNANHTYGRIFAALLGSAAMLSACAPVPQLGARPQVRAAGSIAAERSLGAATDAATQWPGADWWSAYADPQLSALIEEGLKGAPDLAAAIARVRQADAYAQQAGAALLPRLNVDGTASENKQSYNNGIPAEFVPKGWNDTGRVTANLGFDIDLWGRNRAALAAATSDAEAARLELAQTRLTLSTAIATAYADLARLHADRDVLAATVDIRTRTQALVAQRVATGLGNRADLKLADAAVPTARAELAATDESIALTRNRIAALIGAGPDRGLAIARPGATVAARGIPAGATTDLVGRRPDVAAALARVHAAASRIKVARADFYPALSLNALFGVQSLGLSNLFDGGSTYGNAGPAISLPLFQGGAISGRYRGARATYDEAVASYDKTVVGAYQDVADAVTSQTMLVARLADAHKASSDTQEAYDLALQRYRGGLSTYLDVLTAEQNLLASRRTVATLDARAFTLDVALVRALGGGFSRSSLSMTSKDKTRG
ncbi:efflux transporter outer membrane subunit [Sphingobium aquiterrae]|uniref:efflux transporter outer membrane subunit n=1 Tax=Sphingobium aquiterrae TaxID=2038656 RepID=UPI003018A78B